MSINPSAGFYTYVHTTFKTLDDRIDYFVENYEPANLSLSGNITANGTASLTGNVTLGSNDSDQITVNGEVTFNSDVEAANVTIENLSIIDNMTIGQDNTDTLTINSNTAFQSAVVFNDAFEVVGNSTFGTDTTNTVTVTGTLTAPHLTIPLTPNNSLKFGSTHLIKYVEVSTDTNIYDDYSSSVIIIIKNTAGISKAIYYDADDHYNIQASGITTTYLKNSPTSFTRIA